MQGKNHLASWKHPPGTQLHLSSNLTCYGNHQVCISKWIRMYRKDKQVLQKCQFKKLETEILSEKTVFMSTPCPKQFFALGCILKCFVNASYCIFDLHCMKIDSNVISGQVFLRLQCELKATLLATYTSCFHLQKMNHN